MVLSYAQKRAQVSAKYAKKSRRIVASNAKAPTKRPSKKLVDKSQSQQIVRNTKVIRTVTRGLYSRPVLEYNIDVASFAGHTMANLSDWSLYSRIFDPNTVSPIAKKGKINKVQCKIRVDASASTIGNKAIDYTIVLFKPKQAFKQLLSAGSQDTLVTADMTDNGPINYTAARHHLMFNNRLMNVVGVKRLRISNLTGASNRASDLIRDIKLTFYPKLTQDIRLASGAGDKDKWTQIPADDVTFTSQMYLYIFSSESLSQDVNFNIVTRLFTSQMHDGQVST